jgi:hypothetical protein
MFEKLGRAAERMATSVGESRRGFLGRLGRGALAAAGALGGLLLMPKEAQAGYIPRKNCYDRCYRFCVHNGGDPSACDYNCYISCFT